MKKTISILVLGALLLMPIQALASFEDVPEESEYYDAIYYLENTGAIVSGTNFNPEESVTKAAFFKMLLANSGFQPEEDQINYFGDLTGDEWYAPYANKAAELGLIDTSGEHPEFNGGNSLTKAEAAKFILRWGGIASALYIDEEEWNLDYNDISPTHIYAPYVKKVVDLGIIAPENTKYFGTYKKLSRGQAALAIYNMEAYTLTDAYMEIVASQIRDDLDVPLILILEDVYNRLTSEYYSSEDIYGEDLIYEAIKGMTEAAGDQYTVFMDPTESESFYNNLSGEMKGIGAYVHQNDAGTILITGFVDDSPAASSNLQVNDIIVKVNGAEIEGMDLETVIGLIKGEDGTDVDITISRTENGKTRYSTYTITRADFVIPYITTEVLEDNILYYNLLSFGENTGDEFAELTKEVLESSDISGIILDLRNNGGGYVNTTAQILDHFLPHGSIEFMISGTNINTMYISNGPGELMDYPTVILINGYSASASEITASSLQAYGYATIMGTQSFGKGSAQDIYNYYDGSSLKITTSHWQTPTWKDLNGIGVTPDIMTEDDPTTEEDEALEDAINEIMTMMD
ncbi:hypothetical protein COW94_02160 [Candidatus Peregrinibacteria bacterium CG22_combo_CG10-13_8_21_14_all_44_10]|nr:MAG: hypothetical protein AUK45_00195 [Candidatus Peregrinibacteria bacterium CG2_30_44_17]PIP66354.1 MAG: hypothetical protein COW94_02160 [Candidatus Peregrinibacteria bacterium CG22_combo_CG10-13_8_21_14_all_44_10]PIS03548.1 MAG: hypothetical protein COT83_05415 [Candidatus Peregrinibacteria bacterium CG10_big_fil_rev_8_21_14_0_10_44_7]PIX80042.1 MAG: hypothetical protein COZ35_01960 [Candidatus Peregrinibacteria bacterium CG_4_10_14_3_um_filter_44_21]PJB89622.1 MAG: hypothetical protein 